MFPRSAAASGQDGITVTAVDQQTGAFAIITLVNVYVDDFPFGVDVSTSSGLSTALTGGIDLQDIITQGPLTQPATLVAPPPPAPIEEVSEVATDFSEP